MNILKDITKVRDERIDAVKLHYVSKWIYMDK